jgi:hypothetical protein
MTNSPLSGRVWGPVPAEGDCTRRDSRVQIVGRAKLDDASTRIRRAGTGADASLATPEGRFPGLISKGHSTGPVGHATRVAFSRIQTIPPDSGSLTASGAWRRF